MKYLRYLPYLFFFGSFLLAGFSTGKNLEQIIPIRLDRQLSYSVNKRIQAAPSIREQSIAAQMVAPVEPPALQIPVEAVPTPVAGEQDTGVPPRQNNILLIGVDDLTARSPRLEGAWLVLYLAQTPHFTLVPIYPTPPQLAGATASDAQLAKDFQSDPQGAPGPAFFSDLKRRGLWWSGYILVDRYAIAQIMEALDTITNQATPGSTPGSSEIIAQVPFPWEDAGRALQGQTDVVQSVCYAASLLTTQAIQELDDLFLLYDSHIQSDINREQVAAELVGMLVQGNITCEFPFLSVDSQP